MSNPYQHHMPRSGSCPSCGTPNDGATAIEDNTEPPKPGDVAVCFYCAAVSQYGPDLTLQPFPQWRSDITDPAHRKLIARAVLGVTIHRAIEGGPRGKRE